MIETIDAATTTPPAGRKPLKNHARRGGGHKHPFQKENAMTLAVQKSPHEWTEQEVVEAFEPFASYYNPGGIFHDHLFPELAPITRSEFVDAVRADYDANLRGEMFEDHPLAPWWEWASSERERVRDRILASRGLETIGP